MAVVLELTSGDQRSGKCVAPDKLLSSYSLGVKHLQPPYLEIPSTTPLP